MDLSDDYEPVGSATAIVPVEYITDFHDETGMIWDMVGFIDPDVSEEGMDRQYVRVEDRDLEDGTAEYVVELYHLA